MKTLQLTAKTKTVSFDAFITALVFILIIFSTIPNEKAHKRSDYLYA